MPISKIEKTCYFCKPVGRKECDACTNITKSNFVGNADWLYIEQLEKENKELRKYKEETEKWLGGSPYSYVNEDEVNK